jgi:uncharacterized membrane protein
VNASRVVVIVALLAGALWWGRALRQGLAKGLKQRPILIGCMIIGALPALYEALVWLGLLNETYLRLARPWATLLCAYGAVFVAQRLIASRQQLTKARARAVDLITSAAVLFTSLAVGGPEIGRPLDRLTVIVAIDRSRSTDLVAGADKRVELELRAAERGMLRDDRLGTVAFAAEAVVEDPPRPHSELGSPQRAVVGRDGTDLAAAIRRALAEVPPDSAARLVLVSDGVATRGDTMAAAAAAVAAEIPIDVVALEQRVVPDVRVVALRAPTRAGEGESIDLRLVTSSPAAAEIELRVKRDGELISKGTAKINAGEDVLRIKEKAPGPGLHRYDVEITALDAKLDEAAEDNAASTFVRVRGPSSALVLEGDPGKGAFVAKALAAAAFRVDQGGPAAVPGDLGGFASYDVVVLSDIRASDLSAPQLEAIGSYVRDLGGGLLLLGGDRSFGPGGYGKTAVEEISPVSFDLKQDKRRASLAEVIGIDISGSMGAHSGAYTKLELANEAAARSSALLGEGDLLGVEHVDTKVLWSVPLAPVKDKPAIEAAIRGVGVGGGGIFVDITLDAGYEALSKQSVNLKHMLLFADGSDAEQMTGCRAKVSSALASGITTSVVALGSGSDVPELEMLSRIGKGRFYLIEDAGRLPAVFAQETILASRSAIVEKAFRVTRGASSPMLQGVDIDAAPELKGYVVTIPKGRAQVALSGPDGDPILASWSAGVGHTAVFTSDLKDRWGAAWTTWPGAARLIAQTAREVARKADDPRVRVEAEASGGELHVRATVVGDDGRAQSFRRLAVHVAGPDGVAHEVALEASGAGSYAASVPLARPGTYIAVARDELTGEVLGTTGASLSAGDELRPTGSDLGLLTRIAELSGGRRRDTLDGIFLDRAARRFAYDDVTPTLVLLAAFALLFAVAARRIALPAFLVAWPGRVVASLRRKRASAPRPVEHGLADELLKARARKQESAPQGATATPAPSPPVRVPAPSTAIPSSAARASSTPTTSGAPAPTSPTPPPAPPPPATGGRALSAAEILLAKRKGQQK